MGDYADLIVKAAALQGRVAALQGRVAELERTIASVQAVATMWREAVEERTRERDEDTERYQRRVQALEGHLDASIAREDNLQRANAGLQKRLAELESARDEARRIARRVRDLAWEWDLDAASATKLRNLEEETPWIRGGEQFHPTEEGLADE
jgi:chromosome segregation ATPase